MPYPPKYAFLTLLLFLPSVGYAQEKGESTKPAPAKQESGDEAPGENGQPAAPARQTDTTSLMLMIGVPMLLFWFIILRPNRRRDQQRRQMLSQLKKNDRIVTVGGIKGVVTNVKEGNKGDDDEVVVRIDDSTGAKLRLVLSSIARIEAGESEEQAKP